jgi:hypothetical protein
MVIMIQSEGNWQEAVGLGAVGVGGKGVGDGVRDGSPGFGVWTRTVGELVTVWVWVDVKACAISAESSAKEIARLPPIIIMETRAARSPEISSRRAFMERYPLMMDRLLKS